jgi:hypothetical protein
MRIKLDGQTLTATATARDFVSLLPLTLTLRNYGATEEERPSRRATSRQRFEQSAF